VEEIWRPGGGDLEAWRRRSGGLVKEIWRPGGGDLDAWWSRSGGLAEEIWRSGGGVILKPLGSSSFSSVK